MKLQPLLIASAVALLTAHVAFAAEPQDAEKAQIIRNVATLLKDIQIEKVTPKRPRRALRGLDAAGDLLYGQGRQLRNLRRRNVRHQNAGEPH